MKITIELAKLLNGELVSCDSVQLYKGVSIGANIGSFLFLSLLSLSLLLTYQSFPATDEELGGIKQHAVSFVPLGKRYSAAEYIGKERGRGRRRGKGRGRGEREGKEGKIFKQFSSQKHPMKSLTISSNEEKVPLPFSSPSPPFPPLPNPHPPSAPLLVVPVVVGGSFFYLSWFLKNRSPSAPADLEHRKAIMKVREGRGRGGGRKG